MLPYLLVSLQGFVRTIYGGAGEVPDAYDVGLGLAITEEREQQGLTRPDLAEMSTLSYPYVYELEKGKKKASDSALAKIAGALGVSPRDLTDRGKELMPAFEAAEVSSKPVKLLLETSPGDVVDRIVSEVFRQLEPAVRSAVERELRGQL
jgi:transcriptional regulator with XRE-family HTH domain